MEILTRRFEKIKKGNEMKQILEKILHSCRSPDIIKKENKCTKRGKE